ncbi:amino acid adenylation domain-containing protein [Streptomyces tanashiensis]
MLDGYGQVLYWRRLAQIYTALAQGTAVRDRNAGTLRALLDEEAEYQSSPAHESDRSYWLGGVADWPERISLSDRGPGTSRPAERFQPPVRVGRIDELAARYGTPWAVVALAATTAYLHRITQQDEIVIGLPVRARTTRTALTTPGMLANVLPLRLTVRPGLPFRDLVQHVSERASEALAHQRFRGEVLQRELRRTGAAEEASGVVVNVVSFDGQLRFAELTGTVRQLSSGPVRDLSIEFFGGADGADLLLSFDPNPELHDAATVSAHRDRFAAFLGALVDADEERSVGEIEVLTASERSLVDAEAHAHARDFDLTRPLHELVEEQAARTPDAVAAETEDGSLTYRELVGKARALAARLRADGVAAGQVVGVCDERSLHLVVELLAVMTAGAAYLPLDPELPAARLAFQIEDSGARVVLTRSDLAGKLAGTGARTIAVDALLPTLPESGPLRGTATPDDTAYVIYTSGSTGRPKGVAVPHRGVVNRLLWMQEEYGLGADDRVLQKTPFTFDVSVWEFFWPLLTGAVLHLAAPGAQRDPRALADVIRRHRVTTVHFVPSMLDLFLAEPTSQGPAVPAPGRLQRRGAPSRDRRPVLRGPRHGPRTAQPLRADRGLHRRHPLAVHPRGRPWPGAHRPGGRQHQPVRAGQGRPSAAARHRRRAPHRRRPGRLQGTSTARNSPRRASSTTPSAPAGCTAPETWPCSARTGSSSTAAGSTTR